jgi:hypothetical protein
MQIACGAWQLLCHPAPPARLSSVLTQLSASCGSLEINISYADSLWCLAAAMQSSPSDSTQQLAKPAVSQLRQLKKYTGIYYADSLWCLAAAVPSCFLARLSSFHSCHPAAAA